jgi:hypothetical protein
MIERVWGFQDDRGVVDRLTHYCHIVETGIQSYRFLHYTKQGKTQIKAREQGRRGTQKKDPPETE